MFIKNFGVAGSQLILLVCPTWHIYKDDFFIIFPEYEIYKGNIKKVPESIFPRFKISKFPGGQYS
jgi:hypothetical protein